MLNPMLCSQLHHVYYLDCKNDSAEIIQCYGFQEHTTGVKERVHQGKRIFS